MRNLRNKMISRKKNHQQSNNMINLVIYSKNVKDILEGMMSGYHHLLKKYHIHSKVVYDPTQKKWFRVKVKLPQITCTNYHSVLLNKKYIKRFYDKIQKIDKNNYKTGQKDILKKLEYLILEVGNNCDNMLEYLDFFKNQGKDLFFLKKKEYHNPYLLMQIESSKNNVLYSIGKFRKLGKFLGSLFAWYKIYKPPQNMVNQNNNQVLATALKLLNEEDKKKESKKEKTKKKVKKENKKVEKKKQDIKKNDKKKESK